MKLKKLIKDLEGVVVKGSKDIDISGVSSNSKVVYPGNLFIVKKGAQFDGHAFIGEAILTGASAVFVDLYDPTLKQVTQVIHPSPAQFEAQLASRYYQNPGDELFLVGVTGTNGKTTVTYMLKHLFEELGASTGLMGTIEYLAGSHRYVATRTTPDVITVHKLLREMRNQQCEAAVMEVTSHGLQQGRVAELHFDVAVFTNLTQDHLDYHGSMEAYCDAKRRLFLQLENGNKSGVAVVNADDSWAERLIRDLKTPVLTYGLSEGVDLRAKDLHLTTGGSSFRVEHGQDSIELRLSQIGRFNVYNTLASIGVGLTKGWSLTELAGAMQTFSSVPGRMERVENDLGLNIFVDYSHTEDALRNALSSLAELKQGKLSVVFGCGGDRDRDKRAKMAAVAEELADHVVVTSDNPRSEDPEAICDEVMLGFKDQSSVHREVDRRKAIELAIGMAKAGDTVLIAGKGHEAYQQFARETIPFDDRIVAAESCSKREEMMV